MSDWVKMPASYDADISREPEETCEHANAKCEMRQGINTCSCTCYECETAKEK